MSAVAQMTVRLWTREIAIMFRVSERRLIVCVCGGSAVAALFGLLLGVASAGQLTVDIPAILRRNILRTAFGGAILTATLITSILCVTMPARTALQTLLDLLPIHRHIARAGQLAPLFVLGLVFSIALSSISIAVVVKMYADPGHIALAIALLLIVVGLTQTIVVAVFTIVSSSLTRFLRLPQQYSSAIAAGATIALGMLSMVGDVFALGPVNSDPFSWRDLLPNRIAANLVAESTLLVGVGLGAWILVAISCLAASAALYRQDVGSAVIRLFPNTHPHPTPFGVSVWAETLIAIRTPQAILTVLAIIPSIGLVKWMLNNPLLNDSAMFLATAIPLLPSYLSVYAVGRTLRTHWIGAQLQGERLWWTMPKMLSALLISSVLGICTIGIELLLAMVPIEAVPTILSRALLAFCAALLAGTLVPYSEEQPLSTTVSGFTAALLYISISVGLSWAADSIGTVAANILAVLAAILLLATYRIVASNQNADDVRRV
ncbi:hypothetical protein [Plantibacter sp. YIM 135249]|uniref:hypothetical protein n=1 Tax=Plantibacter sp. YIM 135249 TaxID=3423918 RepID=UPI003D32CF24